MYDHDFYARMDNLMIHLLEELALNFLYALYATVRYALIQPVRLVEYIWCYIQDERECERAETIRFENLKQNGHI